MPPAHQPAVRSGLPPPDGAGVRAARGARCCAGRTRESRGAGMNEEPGFIRDTDVWQALARWRAERRRFALATVVATRGFTPRKAGAHMLIGENGETVGTIGGGAIEF